MIDFLKARKVGRGKKIYLSDISKIAQEEREKIMREKIREIVLEELQHCGINKRIDDICDSTKSLEKNIENLKSSLVPLSRSKSDSIRKIKIKRVILELLEKEKRMTASDASVKLDLSRTRCSEYLTELERDNVLKGIVISRQKFYELAEEANAVSVSSASR
jgi:hypothetical protein